MVALNDGVVPIEAARSVQSLPNERAISRPAARGAASGEIGRSNSAVGGTRPAPTNVRVDQPIAPPPTLGGSRPGDTAPPSSAYLAMVINDLRATLRMAEAFRQTVASAEPPAAYARFASRVYALEIQAQQEISRLREEGITTLRQWFA